MEFIRKTGLLWTSLVMIGAGFMTLKMGHLSMGPLLLVGGYCITLPLFLWGAFRRSLGE